MIALSVAKLKMFFAGKRNFSLNKAKKEKKNFFVESLDQCRRLEVREMFFVTSLRQSDHKVVTQHRMFIKFFFRFRSDFLAFFARISYFKFFGV